MEPIEGRHSYEPRLGHGLRHDPFNALVAPRPIGWIGTRSAAGVRNLAPYSFFNALAYHPPTIGFASTGRKDSLRNIEETGVFTWNLATRRLAERMNATSATVDGAVDEFALAGVAALDGRLIDAPLVAESPVNMECRVAQVLQLRTAQGEPIDSWLTIGEVIAIHIDHAFLREGVYDTAAARPITRGGGPADYFEANASTLFRMRRPVDPR